MLIPPQKIQTFKLPQGELNFEHFGKHELILSPHNSIDNMFQIEFWNNKDSIYKILPVTSQGKITGEVTVFSQYPSSGNKILFTIYVINNVWNGKFIGYSHNEPDMIGYFINQIKEGEAIEIG